VFVVSARRGKDRLRHPIHEEHPNIDGHDGDEEVPQCLEALRQLFFVRERPILRCFERTLLVGVEEEAILHPCWTTWQRHLASEGKEDEGAMREEGGGWGEGDSWSNADDIAGASDVEEWIDVDEGLLVPSGEDETVVEHSSSEVCAVLLIRTADLRSRRRFQFRDEVLWVVDK
jgi:hypothetical protein